MQPFVGGPRAGLSEAAVREALSLARGAQVRHGLDVLDATGTATGEVLRFTDGSVTWSYRAPDPLSGQSTDVTQVRRQATLELVGPVSLNLYARRLRLWTEHRLLDGTWARFYLGVFVVTNPGAVSDDGVLTKRSLRLADKSYLWSCAALSDPVYVPSGTDVVAYVKNDLTTRFGETSFSIAATTSTLGTAMVFEPGSTSWLDVYSRLLGAVGYDQLIADEDGRPASQPLSVLAGKGAEITYGAGSGKIVPAGSVEPLSPTLPNRLRFTARQGPASGNTEGNGLYTVVNQSIGPGSVDSRGYYVDQRVEVDATDQATLQAVGDADKQRYFAGGGLKYVGQVALNPRHSDRDVISLVLPRLSISASDWLVTDWTYPLGDLTSDTSALMSLTAERRVP